MLERKLKKYRATFTKQTPVASIPPPSGERSKPGGFRLQAAMQLADNKTKYNTIMVSTCVHQSYNRTNLGAYGQRIVRSAIERAAIDHTVSYKNIEVGKLAQILAQVSVL